MRTRLIIGSILLASFVAPTLAAEYYVVQDSSTKRCTIVEQKPTTTTIVVVGNGMYKRRTEAETAMRTVKVCEQ